GLDRLSREEFVALFLEHGQIVRFVIRLTVAPHPPDDTLPFIGQLADRFVMVHFLSEVLITEGRPSRKFDGGIGEFMPTLPEKFGTTCAVMYQVLALAARVRHGGHAGVAAQRHSGGEASGVGAR